MATKLGYECKLYRSATLMTAATGAEIEGKTWIEITNARDVTPDATRDEADITTRANSGWKQTRGTLAEMTLDFEILYNPADANFAALESAFYGNTLIALADFDGNIVTDGSHGFAANFSITKFTAPEPLADVKKVSVTAKVSEYFVKHTIGD